MVPDESAPRASPEQSYRKSEDVASGLETNAVAGPSTAASAPALTVLPTHAEDAGPVHEELPPVYNPEWNSSAPRVA